MQYLDNRNLPNEVGHIYGFVNEDNFNYYDTTKKKEINQFDAYLKQAENKAVQVTLNSLQVNSCKYIIELLAERGFTLLSRHKNPNTNNQIHSFIKEPEIKFKEKLSIKDFKKLVDQHNKIPQGHKLEEFFNGSIYTSIANGHSGGCCGIRDLIIPMFTDEQISILQEKKDGGFNSPQIIILKLLGEISHNVKKGTLFQWFNKPTLLKEGYGCYYFTSPIVRSMKTQMGYSGVVFKPIFSFKSALTGEPISLDTYCDPSYSVGLEILNFRDEDILNYYK